MKEFTVVIAEELLQGLPPHDGSPMGRYAGILKNVYPGPFALTSAPDVINVAGADTASWPFPQVFGGRWGTLLADEDALYSWDGSALTELITYDWFSPSSLAAISAGGAWQFADFGPTWLLTNGVTMIIRAPMECVPLIQNAVTVQSVCNLRDGRLVLGGFDADTLESHRDILEMYESYAPGEVKAALHNADGADSNWIWWSSIGGGDAFSLWAFNDKYIEFLMRNQSGWAPMPWRGTVQSIIETADGCIVYGDHGITEMRMFTQPVSTLGVSPIRGLRPGIGIAGRGAAAGDEFVHWFVSQDYELWQISGGEAKRLGYREQLSQIGSNIMLCLDSSLGMLWISGSSGAYAYGATGLGGPMDMKLTSLVYDRGALCGAGIGLNAYERPFVIQTRPYDLGDRGMKQISTVQVDARISSSLLVRAEDHLSGVSSPLVRANPNGVAFPRLSAVEPIIEVAGKFRRGESVHVERLEVRYHSEDLRFRRGAKGTAKGTPDSSGAEL